MIISILNLIIELKNIINTYNQFENNELIISKLNNFTLTADDSRKENANKVDHYIDKEISKNFDLERRKYR